MLAEICLGDALAPTLLVQFAIAMVLFVPADLLLTRSGFSRFVWHPSLARFGLFLCVFAGLALLS